jgi:hypothetical protein
VSVPMSPAEVLVIDPLCNLYASQEIFGLNPVVVTHQQQEQVQAPVQQRGCIRSQRGRSYRSANAFNSSLARGSGRCRSSRPSSEEQRDKPAAQRNSSSLPVGGSHTPSQDSQQLIPDR